MSRNLIIYASRKGENYVNGRIERLSKGNTEICAEFIQKAVGGDLFQVETESVYSADYYTCIEEAKTEYNNHSRPKLKNYLDSIDAYDNVFICGPCWWGTYPMAVFSLIERLDFHGKNILPLMTHEGSGLGSSVRDLKKICNGGTIKTGLAVHGADAAQSEQIIAKWAKKGVQK